MGMAEVDSYLDEVSKRNRNIISAGTGLLSNPYVLDADKKTVYNNMVGAINREYHIELQPLGDNETYDSRLITNTAKRIESINKSDFSPKAKQAVILSILNDVSDKASSLETDLLRRDSIKEREDEVASQTSRLQEIWKNAMDGKLNEKDVRDSYEIQNGQHGNTVINNAIAQMTGDNNGVQPTQPTQQSQDSNTPQTTQFIQRAPMSNVPQDTQNISPDSATGGMNGDTTGSFVVKNTEKGAPFPKGGTPDEQIGWYKNNEPKIYYDYMNKINEERKKKETAALKQKDVYSEELNRQLAKQNVGRWGAQTEGIVKTASSALNTLNNLDQTEALLGKTKTGVVQQPINYLRRVAAGIFNINLESASYAEALTAIHNKLALSEKNAGGANSLPGSMSNDDRKYIDATVPGLSNTKDGNLLLSLIIRKQAERNLVIADRAEEWRQKNNGNMDGFTNDIRKYNDKNPMFENINLDFLRSYYNATGSTRGYDDAYAREQRSTGAKDDESPQPQKASDVLRQLMKEKNMSQKEARDFLRKQYEIVSGAE